MTVRFADFAAFVIAACFVVAVFVAPYIMAWHYLDSHFSREAEHDSRPRVEGSGLARPGAPNAPSRPRIAVPHTGDKSGAMPGSSDLQDSPRFGFFALTWGGDPSQEMGRTGASLEGALAEVPPQYLRGLLAVSHLCSVRADLLASLFARESGWRADAVSSAGAVGLGQLMPKTARMMGVTDRTDPWQNMLGSACYLRTLLDRAQGNERQALHDYHAGPWRKRTTRQTIAYASDILTWSAQ